MTLATAPASRRAPHDDDVAELAESLERTDESHAAPRASPHAHMSRARAVALVCGSWSAVGLLLAQQSYFIRMASHYPMGWWRLVTYSLLGTALWMAMTPGIAWLARTFRIEGRFWWRSVAVHVAAIALANYLDTLTSLALAPIVSNPATPVGMLYARLIFSNMTLYLGVAGVATAIDFARLYRERAVAAAELSAKLTQAQLRALQSQLRPHFLFNTLNAVAEQVYVDPYGADRMVMRLSALLRASLHFSERHEIRLREEIATLGHYLEIMEVRHRGRLTVAIDVSTELDGALVPAMVLQPIVENAIHHGAEPSDHPTVVGVRAERVGDALVLSVSDDGAGLAGALREGVGLRNTRERLRQLYGERQRLTVEPRADGGVRSEIVVPLRY